MYHETRAVVCAEDGSTAEFRINKGVKQGCNASPLLFSLLFDRVVEYVKRQFPSRTRNGLFMFATVQIFLMLFADDVVLVAPSVDLLQQMLDAFCQFTTEHHLSVNVEKTKCMLVNCNGTISCYGKAVDNVKEFRYLGIPLLSTARSPEHILQNRLKAAQRAFGALRANARYFGISNCRVRV